MAASTVLTGEGLIGGARWQSGTITFDSDATVEVPTGLAVILAASFVEAVSGGSADTLSIDETATAAGGVAVPSTGKVTVDSAGSSSRVFLYYFIGR